MRILLVEDDHELGQLIMQSLKKRGFVIDQVATVADARHVLSAEEYGAVILDRMLPDGEGLDVARELRRLDVSPPVLMLTAVGGTAQRIEGLDAGADDYLEKPFDMNELVARLRALSRRARKPDKDILQSGRLSFDLDARSVTTPDGPISLSHKEAALMEKLMRRFGVTVMRSQLEQAVYGVDEAVTPNALEAHMSRIRKKLKAADAGVELHTMPGIGYLLREAET